MDLLTKNFPDIPEKISLFIYFLFQTFENDEIGL